MMEKPAKKLTKQQKSARAAAASMAARQARADSDAPAAELALARLQELGVLGAEAALPATEAVVRDSGTPLLLGGKLHVGLIRQLCGDSDATLTFRAMAQMLFASGTTSVESAERQLSQTAQGAPALTRLLRAAIKLAEVVGADGTPLDAALKDAKAALLLEESSLLADSEVLRFADALKQRRQTLHQLVSPPRSTVVITVASEMEQPLLRREGQLRLKSLLRPGHYHSKQQLARCLTSRFQSVWCVAGIEGVGMTAALINLLAEQLPPFAELFVASAGCRLDELVRLLPNLINQHVRVPTLDSALIKACYSSSSALSDRCVVICNADSSSRSRTLCTTRCARRTATLCSRAAT